MNTNTPTTTVVNRRRTREDYEVALSTYHAHGDMYRCPAHEDRTPSLRLGAAYDTPWCFVCQNETLDRLNPLIFDNQSSPMVPRTAPVHTPGAFGKRPPRRALRPELDRIGVARWFYHDAAGRELGLVIRFNLPGGRKYFRQWTPSPDDASIWCETWRGSGRPLYRLPDVLSDDDALYVVEGEKCTDAGTLAWPDRMFTTWAGGAGNWRQTDWLPLAEREVILIADGNDAGHDAMLGLAKRLSTIGCVVTLVLPPTDGTDIADWLALGGVEYADRIIAEHGQIYDPTANIVVSVPDKKHGNFRHGNDKKLPARLRRRGYRPEPRPTDLRCFRFGSKVGRVRHSSGGVYRMAVDCRDCGPDLRWWRMQKREQYGHGRGRGYQTMVRVSGLASDDDAQKLITAIGRTSYADGSRVAFIWKDLASYLWEVAVVYADAVGDRGLVNLNRRGGKDDYDWQIENRRVEPDELDAFMPTQNRTQYRNKSDKPNGGHDPVRFTNWIQPQEELPTDYSWGDVDIDDDAAESAMELPTRDKVADPELDAVADRVSDSWATRWVKNEKRAVINQGRWLAGVQFGGAALLRLQTARNKGQRGDWRGCIVSGTYDGPKRLIIDLALALVKDADGLLCVPMAARAALRRAAAHIVEGV